MKWYFAQSIIDANEANLPQTPDDQATLDRVLTITFMTIGAIAVLMVIIGGLRYVAARGTPEKVTQARNIIFYSLIGLGLSLVAALIVQVVLGRI